MLTITIGTETEATPSAQEQSNDPTKVKRPSELSGGKVALSSATVHQSIGLIKQGVSYYVNNYGSFTGDYTKQKNMQKALGVANDMATLGTAAITTLATGNVAAMIFAVASMALGKTLEGISYYENQKNLRLDASYGLNRLGILNDGSRN